MKKYHNIDGLNFKDNFFIITIDGQIKEYPLKDISPILEKASIRERNNFEVSPSGYGIHWHLLDEDISIDGLLGIKHAPHKRIEESPIIKNI